MRKETVTLVTCKDARQARKIAEALVRERLAACVNILPGVTSIYTWQGKMERSSECLLVVKSRAALAARTAARVRELHTYSVPEVITLPIVSGDPAYLRWVRDATREAP